MNRNLYQTMPRQGRLAENINTPLEGLLDEIAPFRQDTVYPYVVATVECRKGRLYQTGSGPNFQGGRITLCSCKHEMRAYSAIRSLERVWIAGYTGSRRSVSNKLFYLMMVSQTFESHHELWFSDCISEETKVAKAANLDKFGDIYQPKGESGDPYCHLSYVAPCEDHVHCDPCDWHKDIRYPDQYGRIPALLVGDPKFSFMWDITAIESPFKIPRKKRATLADLFPSVSSSGRLIPISCDGATNRSMWI